MKKFLAMCGGLIATLLAVNTWAGTLAPKVTRHERFVMDETFSQQTTQVDRLIDELAAEQGKQKIFAIGDSTMYGAIVHEDETIPYYLRKRLQPAHSSLDVVNLAYPGARPADLYATLKLAQRAKSDLVVIDVNVVFFSNRLLQEAALANVMNKREFLFEPDVPKGIFTENRVEEIVTTAFKDTNIGQYKPEINKRLFGQAPRTYIAQAAQRMQPPQPAAPPAPPAPDILEKSWHERTWDAKEQKTMARIYGQGPLDENNDSVKMLRRIIAYTKQQQIKTLFYLTPQNETLIGKFFSLDSLHQNEDYLASILHQEGAWYVDLRSAVPESVFGDYDHMLGKGNDQVAARLAETIAQAGVLGK